MLTALYFHVYACAYVRFRSYIRYSSFFSSMQFVEVAIFSYSSSSSTASLLLLLVMVIALWLSLTLSINHCNESHNINIIEHSHTDTNNWIDFVSVCIQNNNKLLSHGNSVCHITSFLKRENDKKKLFMFSLFLHTYMHRYLFTIYMCTNNNNFQLTCCFIVINTKLFGRCCFFYFSPDFTVLIFAFAPGQLFFYSSLFISFQLSTILER